MQAKTNLDLEIIIERLNTQVDDQKLGIHVIIGVVLSSYFMHACMHMLHCTITKLQAVTYHELHAVAEKQPQISILVAPFFTYCCPNQEMISSVAAQSCNNWFSSQIFKSQ